MLFSSNFYTFSTFKQSECLIKMKDILVYTLYILLFSVFLTILFLLIILTLEQKNFIHKDLI